MYDDLSRPTAEPLASDDGERSNCRLSLLASALSGYPAFADELLAPYAPPVSVTDLSSQLESYTLQPERQNRTEELSAPSFASFGQTRSSVKSAPIILLHRQSVIRRHRKSTNYTHMHRKVEVLLSEEQQPYDEPGYSHSSLTSYPHDARFLVLPDQPLFCNSDPSAQAIEAEDTDPKTWECRQFKTSGHERMRAPLEKPQRQNLVLKSIRYRKSAERKKSQHRKLSAALRSAL